jgi:DNA polymerase
LERKKALEIGRIAESIKRCDRCELCNSRTNAVPGDGQPSWIVFVGEAPGGREDIEGKPFVGSAGRFLNELLGVAGIPRDAVFITNVVKCRPPANRMPRVKEISACRPHLDAQLEAMHPRLICTLGGVALKSMLGKGSITQARGRPLLRNGVVFFPTVHPAASLYNPQLKDTLRADFELLGKLARGGPDGIEARFAATKGLLTLDHFS